MYPKYNSYLFYFRSTWPKAMAIQTLPNNVPNSLATLLSLVDDICYHTGDRSVDVSVLVFFMKLFHICKRMYSLLTWSLASFNYNNIMKPASICDIILSTVERSFARMNFGFLHIPL